MEKLRFCPPGAVIMPTPQTQQSTSSWHSLRYVAVLAIIMLFISLIWGVSLNRQSGERAVHAPPSGDVLAGGTQEIPLTISVAIENYSDNGDGTWTVRYRYNIHNPSAITANFISATSEVTQDKPGGPDFEIVSFTSPTMSLNPSFNADSQTEMLTGPNILSPGQAKLVYLTIRVVYGFGDPGIFNYVTVFGEGESSGGSASSSGSVPSATSSAAGTGSPTSSNTSPTSTPSSTPSSSAEQYRDDDIITFQPGITSTSSAPCCIK